jgi:hypothetical protein
MEELKTYILDIMGFSNNNGVVCSQDTLMPITVNGRVLTLFQDPTTCYLDLFNIRLIIFIFESYLKSEEAEGNLYILTYGEETSPTDVEKVELSRLVLKTRDMTEYKTEKYYVPCLKYIAMMFILSEMYNPAILRRYDSKELMIQYFAELEKEKKKRKRR